jgi:DNA helicase-2/ATP-dependent DNA helicase PcrA
MSYKPTDEQQQILQHDLKQHGRILAGPGTGKSATVISLLETQLPADGSIKAKLLTFTRAATAELALKLKGNDVLAGLAPSTIHSFCISVLLSEAGLGQFPRPLRIADRWEERTIVSPTLAKQLGIKQNDLKDLIAEMASNWESLSDTESPEIPKELRARFLGAWAEHRRILGYTLLAELPYALYQSLQQHPDLTQGLFDLMVVDEYQDLNACDLAILKEIGKRGCAILGAGDDDQSIYSFRKAHPEGIRRFSDDYPGAADYPLSVTLRCGRKIIDWANWVISQDAGRLAGRTLQPIAGAADGEVGLFSFKSEVAEAKGIAALVQDLITSKKIPPPQVLILLRSDHNGHFSKSIKDALDAKKISYSDPSWVNDVLEARGNRTLLALLRLAVHREDSLAWASLLELQDGIGQTFFNFIYEKARAAPSTFGAALLADHASKFGDGPRSSAKAAALVDNILATLQDIVVPDEMPETGWGAWMQQTFTGAAGNDDLWGLLASVDGRIDKDNVTLEQYLNQITPLARDAALESDNGVRIMSLASSKGLTVEATIIAGVEDGLIPNDKADLAEERRLLYVGMTRAKQVLYCTWARRRGGPTARYGKTNAAGGNKTRNLTHFLVGGPVSSQARDDLAK